MCFCVKQGHAIDFAEEQMPSVLSTPWLIWYMELAAREALVDLLEPGESSVGVHVDVEHLAPTPLGLKVTCRGRVINTDGALISFQIEAHDEAELIARGLHKRRVIQADRFSERVKRKQNRS